MTGKFKDNNNRVIHVAIIITTLVMFLGGTAINIPFVGFFVGILMVAAIFAVVELLEWCSFTADDDKVIFCVGPIKYKYSYSEIESVETQTGFTHSRYGMSPHVELTIKLKNGDTVTFRDNSIPDYALSTPENHKEFHDNHQFTKLSNYINQRAGKSDSNA